MSMAEVIKSIEREALREEQPHEICSRNGEPIDCSTLEDEPVSLGSARKLRKSYIWSKKIRLAVYKIITYLPRIISGNYKKNSTANG